MVEIRWKLQYYWILLYDEMYAIYVSLWKKYKCWQEKRANAQWYKMPIADHFKEAPIKQLLKHTKSLGLRIRFDFHAVNFCMCLRDIESIDVWVHELTEFTLSKIGVIMSNVVELKSMHGGIYDTTAKHIMTALCTKSVVDEITFSGDQFAIYFGFS